MATVVNIHDAKTNLSRILEEVEAGAEVIIARNGRPIARLIRIKAAPRRPGALKGRLRLRRDFDDPLPEEVARPFEGDE
jgi:prevent-host-death family protein